MDRQRGPKDLSDKEHYEEEHNVEYDHEAFLGKEQASEFDQLSHEESRRRLRSVSNMWILNEMSLFRRVDAVFYTRLCAL